jgi:hypothetical protein
MTAIVLISAPLAYAGSKGGGGRSSFGSGKATKSLHQPAQPQTGTVKDLGVNPSSKSPIDSVKSPTTTPPTAAAPSPGPAQQAPAPSAGFFGGGGFGSSWMNWAIIGYLFGRHTGRPEEVKSKEKDKEKEQLKQKEQGAAKEQVKEGSESSAKEQLKDEKPTTQSKSPLELK